MCITLSPSLVQGSELNPKDRKRKGRGQQTGGHPPGGGRDIWGTADCSLWLKLMKEGRQEYVEWQSGSQKGGSFVCHAVAFGIYLKAVGNQRGLKGQVMCSDLSFGRVASVFQGELIGRRQPEIRS